MVAIYIKNIEIAKLLIEKIDLDKNICKNKALKDFIEEVIEDKGKQKELLDAVQKRREEQDKLKETEEETTPCPEVTKPKIPTTSQERVL